MYPEQSGQQPVNGLNPQGGPPFPPYPAASQPPPAGGPAAGQPPAWQPPSPAAYVETPKSRKGPLIAILVAVILLVGGGAAAYFWLYLPNTPANVYKTGLDRSGETFEKLSLQATAADKLEAYNQSAFDGDVTVKHGSGTYSGKLTAQYDPQSSDSTLTVKLRQAGQLEKTVSLQVLTELAEGQSLPDLYFKLSGLTPLGLDGLFPGASRYENQWVNVPPAYLQQMLSADGQTSARQQPMTAEEAAELSKAVIGNMRKYVFSSDPATAVLSQKRFVGTEQLASDITANRYQVTIHKDNAKAFCQAIITDVMSTAGYKKLPWVNAESLADDTKAAIDSCKQDVDDDIKADDSFDLWIDTTYKLVSKARFTNPDSPGEWYEIGQLYKGGDKLPTFMTLHDDKRKQDGTVRLETDLKQQSSKLELTFTDKSQQPLEVKATANFKPQPDAVEVKKPAQSVPISEVLKVLGLDQALAAPAGTDAATLELVES